MIPKKILFVDDDPLVLATSGHGLASQGYAVTAVCTAQEARACAAAESFDIAILDIQLDGCSGLDLGRALQQAHGLPCLYLSAHSDPEYVEAATRLGALTYVVKPVTLDQLIPAIETGLALADDIASLEEERRQLRHALRAGRTTSMAVGMVMASRGLTEQEAYALLRSTARGQRRKLDAVCLEVVESRELGARP